MCQEECWLKVGFDPPISNRYSLRASAALRTPLSLLLHSRMLLWPQSQCSNSCSSTWLRPCDDGCTLTNEVARGHHATDTYGACIYAPADSKDIPNDKHY